MQLKDSHPYGPSSFEVCCGLLFRVEEGWPLTHYQRRDVPGNTGVRSSSSGWLSWPVARPEAGR